MTLEQLMAFTVSPDHDRQQQVWDAIKEGWQKEPYHIRRMLTETSVRASDRRAIFVGVEAYEAAGGLVLRDLFQSDDGGWLQDPALLDRLVAEKLTLAADEIASEGWKWVDAALSFPYGHEQGLRELVGTAVDLTDEECAAHEALRDEYDRLEAEYSEADELPDDIDARLGEIEQALEAFEQRPTVYDPAEIAIAGVFVSLGANGSLSVDRGYVPIYYPPALFWWWYFYDAYAPDIFAEGGMIAASGGFIAIAVAIGMSVWRAREAKNAETYGSARWAEKGEVKAAGLLGADGVVLGRYERAYANVRQPPISTLNLAHMIPLSAVWAGPERDEHFGSPPLLFGKTEGSTPFRLSLHVGDVGHTLVVGPTGAGKSVLLAVMALQFRRYEGSQVFAFDFGGSIRAAALAMGGDWHDLGGDLTDGAASSVSLQPLARVHDTSERAWAADWIAAILIREGITIAPDVKEHLWSALSSLASAPVEERTITGLTVLLQSNDLKQALRPYCVGGPYGRLLDAETEHLGSASVQAFEIEGLVGTGAAPAVLAYLFHRIGDRLDGAPTLLVIDEGWLALDDDAFAGQLREWLKTLRKKNASVIFATQSLSDIDNSTIAPAIIESCPTRLLLPNERAIEPQITAIYRRFGLNDRQIEILARATPKRDYYCQSRRGNRLFELGLSEVGLALVAASAKTDQSAIARTLAEHGREGFLAAWLRQRGAEWAADLIPDLTNLIPPKPEKEQSP